MAKKPTKPETTDRPPMLQLAGIERDLVRKFKGICTFRGTSMSEVVRDWIQEYVSAVESGMEINPARRHSK
jgi:hypothetical protein